MTMRKIINYFNNISKTTKIHMLILIGVCLSLVIAITGFNYVFGSNVDWMKQHIMFPDYFRNLFYEDGELLPDFAMHLGGGQNIFYFAYYGFLSPIILVSYLLPFIPMGIYVMISSILLIILSSILLYYFLRKNNISNNICFITSLLFITSNSYILHSHRHIMFVNYMPFLILGLIGVYRYFEKRKSGLLISSIFLMILTSYYYSVPGLIGICLYAVYYYFKKYPKGNVKNLFKESLFFISRILIGILLSCIILLPIVYVILNGRNDSNIILDLHYFKPRINIDYFVYGTYGLGFTSIVLMSLIYSLMYLRKEYKIMTGLLLILCVFPIFNFILNGGLYLNGKILMPLIPLFSLLIASMIKDIKVNKKSLKWVILGLVVSLLFLRLNVSKKELLFDCIMTLGILYLFKKNNKYYYFIPVILFSLFTAYDSSVNDDLVSIDDYSKQYNYFSYDINNYINKDVDSIYRYQDNLSDANGLNYSHGKLDYRTTLYSSTTNINYLNGFYNTFNNNDIYRNCFMLNQTNNLLFNRFMGIRYLLTSGDAPYGYNKIEEYEDGTLYENNNVYPIGFSSTHLLNVDVYNDLSFIDKTIAYQNNIIIDGNSNNSVLEDSYNKLELDYEVIKQENIELNNTNDHYIIKSKNNGKLLLKLNDSIIDDVLLIRFKMNHLPSCYDGDTSITINGVMNKLTCRGWKYYNGNVTFDYVLSSDESIDELEIIFDKGEYDISDIEIYGIDKSFFSNNDITPLLINYDNKNNILEGTINQGDDGYFIFTIPYDEGFKVFIDDELINIEKVNDSFIGFPITKGQHEIKLDFEAPYFNLGKVITLLSGFGFVGLLIYERKRFK